jgi:hypothetical protein
MHSLQRAAGTMLAAVVISGIAAAQGPGGRSAFDNTGVADTSLFAPITLPAPNAYRLGSGAPGPKYWQNRADYDLQATLDTARATLHGTLRLRYTNNSPDTLRFIWMQMEQNAFKDKSLNSFIFPQESRFGARGFEGGDVVERFDQLSTRVGARTAVKTRVEGTMMKVDLAEPLAPGRVATFSVAWHFLIPEHGADRMGHDGALYELAQWYPRVAVYDDVRGWNIEPYLGQGEFYLEYGDFHYAVTVPTGYIVAGTGELTNPREVLTAEQITRLARASRSDSTIQIISAAELQNGAARTGKAGTLTWKFHAKNVRDVAWAASPQFIWDASSWKGRMAFAYYRPSAVDTWKEAADMSRLSIIEYSERWLEYPYPQISAIEGPISGMEYPMVAMENRSKDRYDLYNVVTHEIGHMWFPMIVGSNERVHMWQDEGFNTFINTFSEARRYPEKGDQMARALGEREYVEAAMKRNVDGPIEMNPDRIDPQLLGLEAYVKPSVGLQLLRQEIMGPAAFDDAFRTYAERWKFKHPTPADFFRTMEDVGGRRLDWFWREWFLENPHFDQAIDTVATKMTGDTTDVAVMFGNRARGALPIHARFTFSDGSVENFDYPAEVWSTNTTHYVRRYRFTGKTVTGIELDPDRRLVDLNRDNNKWGAVLTKPLS